MLTDTPLFKRAEYQGSRMSGTDTDAERLVGLISTNYKDLYRFIFSVLPHHQDAQDVLQETYLTIARKFSEYDPERPFLPWACQFAYNIALRTRDKKNRGVAFLSAELLDVLVRERQAELPTLAARAAALDECLDRLGATDRDLVHGRYTSHTSPDELARRLGVSRRTLFRRLEFVRRVLFECVSRHSALGGEI